MSEQLNETLGQRGPQYGDFGAMSSMSQEIRALFMGYMQQHNPEILPAFRPYMAEAVQMIATKMARIACGNPFNTDSWHDIAGYAKLVENKINHEIAVATEIENQKREEELRQRHAEEPNTGPAHPDVHSATNAEGKAGESSVACANPYASATAPTFIDESPEPLPGTLPQSIDNTSIQYGSLSKAKHVIDSFTVDSPATHLHGDLPVATSPVPTRDGTI